MRKGRSKNGKSLKSALLKIVNLPNSCIQAPIHIPSYPACQPFVHPFSKNFFLSPFFSANELPHKQQFTSIQLTLLTACSLSQGLCLSFLVKDNFSNLRCWMVGRGFEFLIQKFKLSLSIYNIQIIPLATIVTCCYC